VGVEHSETSGEVESLVFPIYRDGKETGQKIKQLETKQYTARGSAKNPDLFGSWKCREGGKLLIITEGEEDCMSVYQLLREAGKDYNVVSLPNGGSSAAVRKHLNWIEQFDSIVLNLDNDEVGQRCATEIAEIITPGKVKIMTLPVKDANEFLLSRRSGKDYLKFLWNAKAFAPDGIINLADCWELIETEDMKPSTPYPWKGLNSKLYGIREREIVTFTAGTGVGKSAVVRELEHWLLMQTPDNIGVMALEESTERTIWGVMSVEANMNLAVKEKRIEALQNGAFTQEDKRKWFDATHGTGRIHTWDHWGSAGERNLLTKLRYMIKGLGCKWVFLDHLNILVSSMEDNGDERRAIDSIMTKLRKLCEETGAGMVLVCHLSRKAGDKGHEQGAEVSLAHLRGSQAIAQLSDGVVALERNQQAEDAKEANLTKIRVLKNRYAGPVGPCGYLAYDDNTGRLTEVFNINEYLAPSPEEAGV
jgi:twinkle protein